MEMTGNVSSSLQADSVAWQAHLQVREQSREEAVEGEDDTTTERTTNPKNSANQH